MYNLDNPQELQAWLEEAKTLKAHKTKGCMPAYKSLSSNTRAGKYLDFKDRIERDPKAKDIIRYIIKECE